MKKLWIHKDTWPCERPWVVMEQESPGSDLYDVMASFSSHRAALNYALWKSALLPNYGGASS